MKLLCDEMLRGLGRWLRAAGYDTAIADKGMDDSAILGWAMREKRILITCDRKMMERRHAPGSLLLLQNQGLHAQAGEVTAKLSIDWCRRPFSRCLICNTPLERGGRGHLSMVPELSRERIENVFYCPVCGKTFWHGSHVDRMTKKLLAWKAAHGPGPGGP